MVADVMIYTEITHCHHRQVCVCALLVYVYVTVHVFKPTSPSRAAGVKAGSVARGGWTGPLPAPTIGSLLAVAAFSKSHQRPVGGWVGSVESGVRQNGGGGEPGSRVASATALPPSVGSESTEKAE